MIRASLCLAFTAIAGVGADTPQSGQEAALLTPGKSVDREISGQTHSYRITAPAGRFFRVTIRQRGVDVAERLFAPGGNLVVEVNAEMRPQGEEAVDFVTDTAGDYRLDVRPAIRGAAGHYQISVTEARAATEHDRLMYEARTLSTQCYRLGRAGEYDRALPLARRALEIGEKELGPQAAYVGGLLYQAGLVLFNQGDQEQAEKLFQRALAIYEKSLGPEDPHLARPMRTLGAIYSFRGENARAKPLIERAVELTERTLGRDHPELIWCLLEASTYHQRTGENARAEQELRRVLEIAGNDPDNDVLSLASALNNLAVLYNSRRDYGRAEPLLNRSVEIVRQAFGPDSPKLALQLQNLGLIAQEQRNDYPRALELYSRALTLLEKSASSQNPRVAAILNNMANIYKSLGEYPKALELHQRVYAMAQEEAGPYGPLTLISLGNIARTYAASGDVGNALKYQARTDEAIEKSLALNLAIGSERQKLAYFNSLSERTSRTISLQAGLASRAPGAPELAALVVLERKGRVLDAMSGSLAALRRRLLPADQEQFDDWNATTGQFARLALNRPSKMLPDEYRRRLAALEEHRDRVEAEISRRSLEFQSLSQPVSLAAVQAAIPAQAALIEFAAYRPFDPKLDNAQAYGEPRYIVYVLRREGEVQWKELGPAEQIDGAVDAFREALRDPRRKDVDRLARVVDENTMRPVRAMVGGATQLLVSPDGSLNLIPIQALVDEQGRYLVERYSISYLTSGRDLLRFEALRAAKSAPLLIADPFFGEAQMAAPAPTQSAATRRGVTAGEDLSTVYFAPLGGTAEEVRAIHSRFPEATVLTGREATESALKQAVAPRILHIATHGFFLRDAAGGAPEKAANRPAGTPAVNAGAAPAVNAGAGLENPLLRSGLALAGANLRQGGADDGIFTALEASGLNLWGTKLVTLSACDTGVGEVKNGEGVYGLRRAFFLAGAETLVMSLWPVSDYMTRQTMTAYYSGLQQGLGRGEALRQAQLAMLARKDRRHPFYWAGFIQSGEWKNLDGK